MAIPTMLPASEKALYRKAKKQGMPGAEAEATLLAEEIAAVAPIVQGAGEGVPPADGDGRRYGGGRNVKKAPPADYDGRRYGGGRNVVRSTLLGG